jgi:Putative Actinobacterial Holin-X, holin superfamily III
MGGRFDKLFRMSRERTPGRIVAEHMAEAPDTKEKTARPNGKIGRVTTEAKGLVDDTKEWVDAKLRLFELDVEEKIDSLANKFVSGAVVVATGALALVFSLVAAALALGDLWGRNSLGFMAVGGSLFLVALLIQLVKPRLVKGSMGGADRSVLDGLTEGTNQKQLPPAPEEETDG